MSTKKICPQCGTEYSVEQKFCPADGTPLRLESPDDHLIGSIIADRYHVDRLLGEGGMGRVYLAEHVRIGRKSAVKVMSPSLAASPDAVSRFNREAANAARINHPNVAQIYDFGETPDGVLYLAMEYVDGETLATLIERDGPFPMSRATQIAKQVADALNAAHHLGIVHRDLKPENIMVGRQLDGSDWVKVVDFGIAKTVQGGRDGEGSQTVTTAGVSLGTPEYMSPEQLAGEKLDHRTDIYSLGLVVFNLLTGELPYPKLTSKETLVRRLTSPPRTLDEVRPDVEWPEGLQRALDRALAPEAADRYDSVAELGRDLLAAGHAADVGDADRTVRVRPAAATATVPRGAAARPAASPPPPPPPVAPRRAGGAVRFVAFGATIVALLAAAGYGVARSRSAPWAGGRPRDTASVSGTVALPAGGPLAAPAPPAPPASGSSTPTGRDDVRPATRADSGPARPAASRAGAARARDAAAAEALPGGPTAPPPAPRAARTTVRVDGARALVVPGVPSSEQIVAQVESALGGRRGVLDLTRRFGGLEALRDSGVHLERHSWMRPADTSAAAGEGGRMSASRQIRLATEDIQSHLDRASQLVARGDFSSLRGAFVELGVELQLFHRFAPAAPTLPALDAAFGRSLENAVAACLAAQPRLPTSADTAATARARRRCESIDPRRARPERMVRVTPRAPTPEPPAR